MHITDTAAIAAKIAELRSGNRLMLGSKLNLHLNFYRRDTPDTRCGTLKIDGGHDASLLDLAIALSAITFMMKILGAIRRALR